MPVLKPGDMTEEEIVRAAGREHLGGPLEEAPKKPLQLFDNPVDGMNNGSCTDLRLRFAMQLLTHNPAQGTPREAARYALDVASELVELALERGLLDPLDSEAGWERLLGHVKRQVAFQKAMAEETRRAQDQSLAIGRNVHGALAKN